MDINLINDKDYQIANHPSYKKFWVSMEGIVNTRKGNVGIWIPFDGMLIFDRILNITKTIKSKKVISFCKDIDGVHDRSDVSTARHLKFIQYCFDHLEDIIINKFGDKCIPIRLQYSPISYGTIILHSPKKKETYTPITNILANIEMYQLEQLGK